MPRPVPPNAAPGVPHLTPPPSPPPVRGAPPPACRRAPTGRRLRDWLDGLAGRLRDAAEALGSSRGGRALHEFADVVGSTRDLDRVEAALVRLAGELAGASRVELLVDRDPATDPDPSPVAVWPEASKALTPDEVEALGYPLGFGLWCGDDARMTLRLYARPGQGGRWPRRSVRRLTTLCAMASAAERGLHAGRRARPEASVETAAAVRDATFLNAILPYALAQAHRHREPLTVFCAEIDRLKGLGASHGPGAPDLAVRRVAEAVARALRGSDIVARLDDDRLVMVLPGTGTADAPTVAGVVRSAIAGACLPTAEVPALTVSLGLACFPDDAHDMASLLHAADEAMDRDRASGPDRNADRATPPPATEPASVAG